MAKEPKTKEEKVAVEPQEKWQGKIKVPEWQDKIEPPKPGEDQRVEKMQPPRPFPGPPPVKPSEPQPSKEKATGEGTGTSPKGGQGNTEEK